MVLGNSFRVSVVDIIDFDSLSRSRRNVDLIRIDLGNKSCVVKDDFIVFYYDHKLARFILNCRGKYTVSKRIDNKYVLSEAYINDFMKKIMNTVYWYANEYIAPNYTVLTKLPSILKEFIENNEDRYARFEVLPKALKYGDKKDIERIEILLFHFNDFDDVKIGKIKINSYDYLSNTFIEVQLKGANMLFTIEEEGKDYYLKVLHTYKEKEFENARYNLFKGLKDESFLEMYSGISEEKAKYGYLSNDILVHILLYARSFIRSSDYKIMKAFNKFTQGNNFTIRRYEDIFDLNVEGSNGKYRLQFLNYEFDSMERMGVYHYYIYNSWEILSESDTYYGNDTDGILKYVYDKINPFPNIKLDSQLLLSIWRILYKHDVIKLDNIYELLSEKSDLDSIKLIDEDGKYMSFIDYDESYKRYLLNYKNCKYEIKFDGKKFAGISVPHLHNHITLKELREIRDKINKYDRLIDFVKTKIEKK